MPRTYNQLSKNERQQAIAKAFAVVVEVESDLTDGDDKTEFCLLLAYARKHCPELWNMTVACAEDGIFVNLEGGDGAVLSVQPTQVNDAEDEVDWGFDVSEVEN